MADIRADMSKFMSGSEAKETVVEAPKEPVDTVEKEAADVDQLDEETNEPVKKESKEDSKEDEAVEGKKDSKDGKPNRYQRVKNQRDQAEAKLIQKEEHFNKAVKVANAWRQEAKMLEKELQSVLSKAKSAGYERSADEDRAFLSDRELANLKLEKQFDEQTKQESTNKQISAYKERLKQGFIDDAQNLGSKYEVDSKKLMTQYYAELEAGEKVTMEDVAKDMGELEAHRRHKRGVNKQIEVNDDAPRVNKPGKSVGVNYPATPEGMKRWLKSQGLANKEE